MSSRSHSDPTHPLESISYTPVPLSLTLLFLYWVAQLCKDNKQGLQVQCGFGWGDGVGKCRGRRMEKRFRPIGRKQQVFMGRTAGVVEWPGKPIGREAHYNQVHVKATIMDSDSLLLILKWTFGEREGAGLCVWWLWVSCFVQDGGVGCSDLWDRTSTLAHTHLFPVLVHEETKQVWLSLFIRSTFVFFSLCSLSEEESTPEPY